MYGSFFRFVTIYAFVKLTVGRTVKRTDSFRVGRRPCMQGGKKERKGKEKCRYL